MWDRRPHPKSWSITGTSKQKEPRDTDAQMEPITHRTLVSLSGIVVCGERPRGGHNEWVPRVLKDIRIRVAIHANALMRRASRQTGGVEKTSPWGCRPHWMQSVSSRSPRSTAGISSILITTSLDQATSTLATPSSNITGQIRSVIGTRDLTRAVSEAALHQLQLPVVRTLTPTIASTTKRRGCAE